MVVPIDSSRSASASSSFGVVNMQRMSWPGLENRDRLIDDVILVGLQVLAPALLDQLDHPARIEVDAEADAAAILREVLDRQAKAPRTGRTEHQPVRALRKVFVRQRRAEQLVVDPEVVAGDARLRNAGRAAGLEDDRPACPPGPWESIAAPVRRAAIRPRNSPKRFRSAKPRISRRGSQPVLLANSSQNGQPVAGSKCQSTTSRTQASSVSRAAAADGANGVADEPVPPVGEESIAS